MHELSIALSVLEIMEEEAARQNGRVTAVYIKLGPLSGVVKEALISAFDLAKEQSPFPDCTMTIRDVPLVAFCPNCQANREVESIQKLACPICGTVTPEIVSGREMEIVAMEIADEQANPVG
jgi:hydrogenase nickel incorporation protein HypA/HybF